VNSTLDQYLQRLQETDFKEHGVLVHKASKTSHASMIYGQGLCHEDSYESSKLDFSFIASVLITRLPKLSASSGLMKLRLLKQMS